MNLKTMLEQKFIQPVQCYGHCGQLSHFTMISDRPLVACYRCESGYVSRIMIYGNDVHPNTLKQLVADALGDSRNIHDEDVRVATRHDWDFGIELSGGLIKAAYWTQNYRRSKIDDPNHTALFLCSKCRSLFLQSLTNHWTLCEECRAKA